MDLYDAFEELSGARWTGLSLQSAPEESTSEGRRICEALHESFEGDLVLDAEDVVCPGGRRCLGVARDPDEMALHIHQAAALPLSQARGIVAATPRFRGRVGSLRLGRIASPTVLVASPRPEEAMTLLRRWQCREGDALSGALSAFGAVCSTVAASANESALLFTLGCPESRRLGALASDRLVAAIARETAEELLRSAGLAWREDPRPRRPRPTASRRLPSASA